MQPPVVGQEGQASEADGGEISWDIDMTEAEGAPEPEQGQADIDWDADPVPEGDASIQNIDWDIGVDDIAGLEPAAVTQTGKYLTVCLTFAPACNAIIRVHELSLLVTSGMISSRHASLGSYAVINW